MNNVHPKLAQLEQSYDQLVTAAEAGHISQADAIVTLAGLTVIDAAGAVWAINADGDYVRSAFPGAPAQVADPTHFADTAGTGPQPYLTNPGAFPADPTQHPTQHQAAQPQPTSPTGPTDGPAAGFPTGPAVGFPAPPAAPGPFPAADNPTTPFGAGAWAPTAPTQPAHAQPAHPGFPGAPSAANPLSVPDLTAAHTPTERTKNTRSLRDADRPGLAGGLPAKVKAYVAANKALAAIVLVGAIIMTTLALHSGGSAPTKFPHGTNTPATTTPTGQNEATTPPLPDPTPTPDAATLPTRALAIQALSALTSKRPELVAATTATTPTPAEVAKATALWAGVDVVGLRVDMGPAAAQGKEAIQQWVVTDQSTTVADITVTWKRVGGTWKLTTLPTF